MTKTPSALAEIIQSKPIPTEVSNKVISHSQFSTYSSCQYQWKLKYIDKIKLFSGGINSCFGTSMHEVFQEYLRVMYNESIKKADAIDLESLLHERMMFNYAEERIKNNGEDFSSLEELTEFYDDGCAILRWFKSHRMTFFSIRGYKLLGIEVPLMVPTDANPNVYLNGFLDLVFASEEGGQIKKIIIYDIKTSTRGWKDDKEKKDKIKLSQILNYKRYFAKQYEIPEDDIEVVFFIVKRKIWENCDYPQPRASVFRPACGTAKVREANHMMSQFVNACFTPEGEYNLYREWPKSPGYACKYCPYNSDLSLCNQSNK
jgi:hypothetical protein